MEMNFQIPEEEMNQGVGRDATTIIFEWELGSKKEKNSKQSRRFGGRVLQGQTRLGSRIDGEGFTFLLHFHGGWSKPIRAILLTDQLMLIYISLHDSLFLSYLLQFLV